jgi:hypothetical protein
MSFSYLSQASSIFKSDFVLAEYNEESIVEDLKFSIHDCVSSTALCCSLLENLSTFHVLIGPCCDSQ